MKSFCASAPGKVMWLGGYSVLEKGNASLVTPMAARARAFCALLPREKGGARAVLKSPQFGINLDGKIGANGKINFARASVSSLHSARFILSASEICLKYFIAKGLPISGFELCVENDAAFGKKGAKTGLGSSAAATAASVGAILGLFGINIASGFGMQIAHNLSQMAHSKAQGKIGSGFDIASAVYGPITYSRYSSDLVEKGLKLKWKKFADLVEKSWDCQIAPIALPNNFIPLLAYAGKSASTSEMIGKIVKMKAKGKQDYAALIHEIDSANAQAISDLGRGDMASFKHHFKDGRLPTKKLGELAGAEIESSAMTRLIEESMGHGAFVCKLPGAGGGDIIAAICLSKKDAIRLREFWRSRKLKVLNVGFGKEGLLRC
ncbi:MAG: hypothetical protein AABX01_04075 [Candidatus Micrarchaeota archaeon]